MSDGGGRWGVLPRRQDGGADEAARCGTGIPTACGFCKVVFRVRNGELLCTAISSDLSYPSPVYSHGKFTADYQTIISKN